MPVPDKAFPDQEQRGAEGARDSHREGEPQHDEAEQPKDIHQVLEQIRTLAPKVLEAEGKNINAYVTAISNLLDGVRVEQFPENVRDEVTRAIEGWHGLDNSTENLNTLLQTLESAHSDAVLDTSTTTPELDAPARTEAGAEFVATDPEELDLRREHREIVAKQVVAARDIVNDARTIASLREIAKAAEHMDGSELIDYVQENITPKALIEARSQAIDVLQKNDPSSQWGDRLSRHYKPDFLVRDEKTGENKLHIRPSTLFYTVGRYTESLGPRAVGDVAKLVTDAVPGTFKAVTKVGKKGASWMSRKIRTLVEQRRVEAKMEADPHAEFKVDIAGPYTVARIEQMLNDLREIGFHEEGKKAIGLALEKMGKQEPGVDDRPGMRSVIRAEKLSRTETAFANNLVADQLSNLEDTPDKEAVLNWFEQNRRSITLDSFTKVESNPTGAGAEAPTEAPTEARYELTTGAKDQSGKDIVITLTAADVAAMQAKLKDAHTDDMRQEMSQDLLKEAARQQIAESGNKDLAEWYQKNAGKLSELKIETVDHEDTGTEYQLDTGVKGKDGENIMLKLESAQVDKAQTVAEIVADHSPSLRAAARFWMRQSNDKGLVDAANFHKFNVEMQHDGTMIIDVLTDTGSRLIAAPEKFTNQVIDMLKNREANAPIAGPEAFQELWGKSGRGGKGGKRVAAENTVEADAEAHETDPEPKTEMMINEPAANDTETIGAVKDGTTTEAADTGGAEEYENTPGTPGVVEAANTAPIETNTIPLIDEASDIILRNLIPKIQETQLDISNHPVIDFLKPGGTFRTDLTIRFDNVGNLVVGKKTGNTIDAQDRITLHKDFFTLIKGDLETGGHNIATIEQVINDYGIVNHDEVEERTESMPTQNTGTTAGPTVRLDNDAEPQSNAENSQKREALKEKMYNLTDKANADLDSARSSGGDSISIVTALVKEAIAQGLTSLLPQTIARFSMDGGAKNGVAMLREMPKGKERNIAVNLSIKTISETIQRDGALKLIDELVTPEGHDRALEFLNR